MLLLGTGIGAGVGAVVRFLLSKTNQRLFPLGTFLANIFASGILGLLFGMSVEKSQMLVFGTGFCGGLSTFSTFQFELFDLKEEQHEKAFARYCIFSYAFGFLAVLAGYLIGKMLK